MKEANKGNYTVQSKGGLDIETLQISGDLISLLKFSNVT